MRFNPTKYETLCCNDVIYSKFPGEFRKCRCGQVAVDQTEYYERWIGDDKMLVSIGRLHDEKENDEG